MSHSQVMYGGRAIDSFDRRILTVYMDEYLGDFIFDTFQPFHFFHNKDVDYKIPRDGPKQLYVGMSPPIVQHQKDTGWSLTVTQTFSCHVLQMRSSLCLLLTQQRCLVCIRMRRSDTTHRLLETCGLIL